MYFTPDNCLRLSENKKNCEMYDKNLLFETKKYRIKT